MRFRGVFWVVIGALALTGRVSAEELGPQLHVLQTRVDALLKTVASQANKIDEQRARIDQQDQALQRMVQSAPIAPDAVLARIERADAQSAQAIKIASRKKPNELNMSIGAAIDTSYSFFDGPKSDANGRAAGSDFAVRGAELVFYTDVDPYFKTYMVLNATPDPKNNDEAVPSLEEAAIMTTSLSYAQVKGGRFFLPFGRLSMIHDHDLPFTTRPPSLDHYVGGESSGDGVQVQALLPISHFLQITGGAFNKVGAETPLTNTVGNRRDGNELSYFAKALTSFDIGTDHTIEWGVSSVQNPATETRRDLLDMELTYKWHPSGSPLRERLVWGTEILREDLRTQFHAAPAGDPLDDSIAQGAARRGYGGYTYAEYFLNRNWSLGPRVDLFENVDPQIVSKRTYDQTYTAFLSYKFSEFSRLRFEYDRQYLFDGRSANQFYLQWTVFWGAHTHSFEQR